MKKLILVIVALTLIISACKKSSGSTTPPPVPTLPPLPASGAVAFVSGAPMVFYAVFAYYLSPNDIEITFSADSANIYPFFILDLRSSDSIRTGVYSFETPPTNTLQANLIYHEMRYNGVVDFLPRSVSVNVKSYDKTSIAGTIDATLTGPDSTKTITNGQFKVKLP